MKPNPKVREQLERVKSALTALRDAADIAGHEEAWHQFLVQLDRLWNKAEAHFSHSPKWGSWNGQFARKRKSDPLLLYLFQARNADEHGIDEIAERHPARTIFNSLAPGGAMIINRLEMQDGKFTHMDIRTPYAIEQIPRHLKLLDVKNRGVLYTVPETHLGQRLQASDPLAIATLGLGFYESFLSDAEKFFYQ